MKEIIERMLKDLNDGKCIAICDVDAYNEDGDDEYVPIDEICNIDNKKLDLSSFTSGVFHWSEREQCYISQYHYSSEEVYLSKVLFSIDYNMNNYNLIFPEFDFKSDEDENNYETFRFKLENDIFEHVKEEK